LKNLVLEGDGVVVVKWCAVKVKLCEKISEEDIQFD
jgi:hypothetical protein